MTIRPRALLRVPLKVPKNMLRLKNVQRFIVFFVLLYDRKHCYKQLFGTIGNLKSYLGEMPKAANL